MMQRPRPKSACGKQLGAKSKGNEAEEDEEELKMIHNDENDLEAAETRAARNGNVSHSKGGAKGKKKKSPLAFEEFEETLRQMEKEIQNNHKMIDNKLSEQEKQMELNSKLPIQSDKQGKGKVEIPKESKKQSSALAHKDNKEKEPNRQRSDDEAEEEGVKEQDEDNAEEEDKNDIFEITKDIDKKFDKLNDIEDCMKRLDCMLDNSKKSSLKMKYDHEFNAQGYRSEEEDKSNLPKENKPFNNKKDSTSINPPLPKPPTISCTKHVNKPFNDKEYGYLSEEQVRKEEHTVTYENDLRDSELYLTNAKLNEQLIQKEMQIRQNLHTSPTKRNQDLDDANYLDENERGDSYDDDQDAINQARLLSIKNELLKSNKLNKNDFQLMKDCSLQSNQQQVNYPFVNQANDRSNYYQQPILSHYSEGYNHLPMPKKESDYNCQGDAHCEEIPIRNNAAQPKKPIAPSYSKQEFNQPKNNYQYNPINHQQLQPNKPLYSLSNFNENETPSFQAGFRDALEDEKPYQFKPNKQNGVAPSYTTSGSQGKSIKIERNIIDITKHKAKVPQNETNQIDFSSKASAMTGTNHQMPKRVEDPSLDPINYFKNLLEKTKDEIDSLTQGLDDIQPSITSYPQPNYTPMPRQDYYHLPNKQK